MFYMNALGFMPNFFFYSVYKYAPLLTQQNKQKLQECLKLLSGY